MKNLLKNLPEDISGKTVLVAGGASGTGRDITITLASKGARVMILDENHDDVDQTMSDLRSVDCESNCYGMVADLANPNDIKIILSVIDRHFRGIDILINNNMFTFPKYAGNSERNLQESLYSKLKGQFICTKELLKRMEKKGKQGYVVNLNTTGKDLRRQLININNQVKEAFRTFNSQLCQEAANKNVRVVLSTI